MLGLSFLAIAATLIFSLAWFDRLQSTNPLLRVYPVIGRLYLLLLKLRKLAYANRDVGYPFTVDQLETIRTRATTGSVATSFGAPVPLDRITTIDVAILPVDVPSPGPVIVDGIDLTSTPPVAVPVLNFGAMGVGPVSINTTRAVGVAARTVNCLQNTSELGLNQINLEGGAGLIWQIGPGYWGCRDSSGRFNEEKFAIAASNPSVKLIEIKLAQGARVGGGGFFPGKKNTRSVARVLGVEPHTDVTSPPQHSAFSSLEKMLEFIQRLNDVSRKPVGIKVCIGSNRGAEELVNTIRRTAIVPSFITVDGGEGGTGSGAYELQQYAGLPAARALPLLTTALLESGFRQNTRLFVAGRISSGYDLFRYLCLGADVGLFTRAPMVAMGCIQARRCHIGTCPTGIAAERLWRRGAISPKTQGAQLAQYYQVVMSGFMQLLRASGRSIDNLDSSCLIEPQSN